MLITLRVLIIEDQTTEAAKLAAALSQAGYNLEWQRVDSEAGYLAALHTNTYDLILSDYTLAGFDGLRALRLFVERDLDIPFIIVTDRANEDHAIACIRQGADDYIFTDHLTRLAPAVDRALNDRRLRRENRLQNNQLRLALEQERELSALKSRFLSIVSHEFRTPLAVILTSSELLDRYGDRLTDERRRACYDTIRSQVKNLSNMLDDVSTVIRAETGRLEFKPGLFDLGQFCADILEETRETIGVAHTLTFQMGDQPVPVYADATLLKHALRNLLTNAVKYSPQGREIRLELDQPQPDQVIIQVSDEGIGIPEADLPRLFEPYYRASNVQDINGTGIGLKIVKDAVDLHGGTVAIASREGAGTTVTLTLPLNNARQE